jgi:ferritin-like metal-binding protein YciE
MSLQSLQDLFVDEIKDLYSAEKQLVKALPKMASTASNEELKAGIEKHLEETKGHVERIEQIFRTIGMSAKAKHCKAMEGLIEEGEEILEEKGDPSVIDAAIIGAAQKVEHYEIASYGCARAHAELLGLNDAVQLLQQTLDEEKATDEKLSNLAESVINMEAEGRRVRREKSESARSPSQL